MTQVVTQSNDFQFELNADVHTENQLAKHAIHVHKFGGSSLATPECIARVVDIIQQNCQLNDIVVVSANGKTTDQLFELYSLACELLTQSESDNTLADDAEQALTKATAALFESQEQLIQKEKLE